VSLAIPNTTTQATYVAATTFPVEQGAGTPFASGYLVIANNSATVSVLRGTGQGSASWGPDFSYAPTTLPLSAGLDPTSGKIRDFIFGVRARDEVAGTHAQVFGGLFQLGDVTLNPGNQFTGTVSPSGGFLPPGTGMITGLVAASGAITAGSGFTVAHPGNGLYTLTFTSPFASIPVVVGNPDGASDMIMQVSTVGASGASVGIETRMPATGVLTDTGFRFLAVATV
jgi:hypothetical protein